MEGILSKIRRKLIFTAGILFIVFFMDMGFMTEITRNEGKPIYTDHEFYSMSEIKGYHTKVQIEQVKKIMEERALLPDNWELQEIEKYIDLKNEQHIDKVLRITETTPLDAVAASIIVSYTEKLNVPLSLMLSIIDIESNFGQYEVGSSRDRGYCQIVPSAEKWLTKNHGHLVGIQYDPARIFEPEYNLALGTLYIHLLNKAYKNDSHRVLSEYNRGPYNLKKYYNTYKTYESDYSRKVLDNEKKYKKLLI